MKFLKENWLIILIMAIAAASYFFVDWSEFGIFSWFK